MSIICCQQGVGLLESLNHLLAHIISCIPAKKQGASADKLRVKAARILPLVGLARSKQDPINRGHCAQYLYCPAPTGANIFFLGLLLSGNLDSSGAWQERCSSLGARGHAAPAAATHGPSAASGRSLPQLCGAHGGNAAHQGAGKWRRSDRGPCARSHGRAGKEVAFDARLLPCLAGQLQLPSMYQQSYTFA